MDKKNGAPKKLSRTDKHDRLFEMIRMLAAREFTGYLKVNFSQGGIGRIEKLEELALNREDPKE
ncbi:MAG: hypothetical protein GYA56_08640 [Geobacteraceae bacterium]|nr:hypothetical protein [Geobacteraceae bacterium]